MTSTISDLVLIESKAARNDHLSKISHDRSQEILLKVKGLYFALWQGTGVTTTDQVAEFYEVPVETVKTALSRHKDEFTEDGLRELKGKDLKALRDAGSDALKLPESTTRLNAWTPRAALRLGMTLEKSEVARQVRTSLLDAVEEVLPIQSEKIKQLELENENLRLKQDVAKVQERLIARSELLALTAPQLATAILCPEVTVIEKVEVKEVTVMVDPAGQPVAQYDGMSITQLAKRYGFGSGRKATDACKSWLLSLGVKQDEWVPEPMARVTWKLPREKLKALDQEFLARGGNRQKLIGEFG